ncbi:MAG: C1 family peptidase [Cytophagaceae bacterium]
MRIKPYLIYFLVATVFFGSLSCNKSRSKKEMPLGCVTNKEEFKKTDIFEPLDGGSPKNSIPSAYSLRKFCPKRGNQGQQSSCVGWSSSYGGRTILQAYATGANPNDIAFSPSFIYNSIRESDCSHGTFIGDALDMMINTGDIALSEFPYDANSCDQKPDESQLNKAGAFRIEGYNRLTDGDKFSINLNAIKQNISQGAPVIIAVPVGGSFDKLYGEKIWEPTDDDYAELEKYKNGDYDNCALGGHAMCLIGYDDNFEGGSVEIMNSWGEDFGEEGIFWMRYSDFKNFCREAYGFFPVERKNADNLSFGASVGLLINKTRDYMALEHSKGYTFTTDEQNIGTKFKMEVTNSIACYTYVIGLDTNGESYILFPYTDNHSPYCGITGTRVFPGDYSMQLDNIGKKDLMAVILTKDAIDINNINDKVNKSKASGYEARVKEALGSQLIAVNDLDFETNKTVDFKVKESDKNAVLIVVEINKNGSGNNTNNTKRNDDNDNNNSNDDNSDDDNTTQDEDNDDPSLIDDYNNAK